MVFGDGHGSPPQIDPLGPEAEELAGKEPAVGGKQYRRPVPGVDGIGEGIDLAGSQEAHLGSFDTREANPVAG